MTTITRFGENENEQWYETTEGIFPCDEDTIHAIWMEWVCRTDSRREDDDTYIIFTFGTPPTIDLTTTTSAS